MSRKVGSRVWGWVWGGVLAVVLVACTTPTSTPVIFPTPTPLPSQADETARAFLGAWERGAYGEMYALCASEVRASLTEEEFAEIYADVLETVTAKAVRPELRAVLTTGRRAEAAFRVTWETVLVGTFTTENSLFLRWEGERWVVEWSRATIFRELTGDRRLLMIPRVPVRANIYDREGRGLAVEQKEVLVGVVPGQIEDEGVLLSTLAPIVGMDPAAIQEKYAGARPDWFVPVAQIGLDVAQQHYETLRRLPGVELRDAFRRVYTPVAPHIVGYMGYISPEDLPVWQAKGYTGDELVGRAGLEAWGEEYLAGGRGGLLAVISPNGELVATLAEKRAEPSRSIYTTFDMEFQRKVEDLLGERHGAVVVLDVHTGAVLALATWPRFDPNLFANGISVEDWAMLSSDPDHPLLDRATQGVYPPGSTFKIVTMATALEKGGMKPESTFTCTGGWNKLGRLMTCWLKSGHGTIDLVKALTVSCDVTFYEVGYQLYQVDPDLLPSFARAFGLGSPTGIEEPGEQGGLVPDGAWKWETYGEGWAAGDSVNLAIGQGFLLVTPLQMARLVAAVANGGTLYRPYVVDRVVGVDEASTIETQPEVVGKLPVSAETLAAIREGLLGVTTKPYGTAVRPFAGFPLKVAGKTGTAETEEEKPHAWFVGYVPADDPQIAIAVVVEHSGEGTTYAAPLFRQVAATYFGLEDDPSLQEVESGE